MANNDSLNKNFSATGLSQGLCPRLRVNEGSNGVVLLLEDNTKILDINRRILEKDGLLVLTAESIAQARERIKITIPDVAVLDIMLPDGSGLDFLDELREVCDAPVLFLSAKAKRADVLAGLKAGGNII